MFVRCYIQSRELNVKSRFYDSMLTTVLLLCSSYQSIPGWNESSTFPSGSRLRLTLFVICYLELLFYEFVQLAKCSFTISCKKFSDTYRFS